MEEALPAEHRGDTALTAIMVLRSKHVPGTLLMPYAPLVFVTNPCDRVTTDPAHATGRENRGPERRSPGAAEEPSAVAHREPGLSLPPPPPHAGSFCPCGSIRSSSPRPLLSVFVSTYFSQLCTLEVRGDGAEEGRGGGTQGFQRKRAWGTPSPC